MPLGFKRSFGFLLLDLVGLFVSLLMAVYVRLGHTKIEEPSYLIIFLIIIVVNYFFGLYSNQTFLRPFSPIFYKFISSSLGFFLIATAIFLFFEREEVFGRGVLFLFFGFYSVIGVFIYSLLMLINRTLQEGRKIILLYPKIYDLKTLIDSLKQSNTFSHIIPINIEADDTNFVGKFKKELDKVSYRYLTLVIADECFNSVLFDFLLSKKIEGVRIYRLSSFFEKYFFRLPVSFMDPSHLIFSGKFKLSHDLISLRVKRITDIFLCLFLFILIWPVILVSALLVRLTSQGPAFYLQKRVGQYGRSFTIYKLRTMVKDAEKDGAQWAIKGDRRITFLGKFLRLSRIDELPQLWNIMKGDMSFIGPRPERQEFVDDLEKEIPYYNLRHLVKPGISGWAQVMYPYGASVEDAREKLSYDIFYVKNFSFFLDIYIGFKTMQVVTKLLGR